MFSKLCHKSKGYCSQQNYKFCILPRKNKSLMKILKRKDPNKDPCGIPLTTSLQSLNVGPNLIFRVLLYLKTFPNLNKAYCVLYAFQKSQKILLKKDSK